MAVKKPLANYGGAVKEIQSGDVPYLGTSGTDYVAPNGALGTPSSGNLSFCTFPTLNQNTTGSAAKLTTPRAIYGNNFDGSTDLNQIIIGTYGGTGVNNSTRTMTYAGNVAFTGDFNVSFTVPGAYTYIFPNPPYGTTINLAFRNIPVNGKNVNYTCTIDDAGTVIAHPSSDTTGRTFIIPANASVAYEAGTVLTFLNQNGGGLITIAITSDIMRQVGTGLTGSRTLAANGIATALKITSIEWLIAGAD